MVFNFWIFRYFIDSNNLCLLLNFFDTSPVGYFLLKNYLVLNIERNKITYSYIVCVLKRTVCFSLLGEVLMRSDCRFSVFSWRTAFIQIDFDRQFYQWFFFMPILFLLTWKWLLVFGCFLMSYIPFAINNKLADYVLEKFHWFTWHNWALHPKSLAFFFLIFPWLRELSFLVMIAIAFMSLHLVAIEFMSLGNAGKNSARNYIIGGWWKIKTASIKHIIITLY